MIVFRDVMAAQFGRGSDLAAIFVEGSRNLAAELGTGRRWRVPTDPASPFDTVLLE